jgi:predicted Rossmann fold flavoprotein
MKKVDVLIIGAGAAGLMCAIEAGKRQRNVLILEHSNKPGKKILMSGGGRCNFTNYNVTSDNFISHNAHFCKSALSRYTQWDFISLVKKYQIPFHEKTLGQLFCDNKAKDILNMLLSEAEKYHVEIQLNTAVTKIEKLSNGHFKLKTDDNEIHAQSVVIASGGLSIPTMGSSAFGYKIAEQFGIKIWPTRAGLVPLTLHVEEKEKFSDLSGISAHCIAKSNTMEFNENLLFTHRGLSGPAILQISSYWEPGMYIDIDLLPLIDLKEKLKESRTLFPQKQLKNVLSEFLQKKIVETILSPDLSERKLGSLSYQDFENVALLFHKWKIKPNGTEGYRTAEVTLGGVDCNAISSKTMEANEVEGLYFIGEVLDVTGWLGGYNFQWAWSSGWAAGQVV